LCNNINCFAERPVIACEASFGNMSVLPNDP
jgi:hypothetical protein